MQVSTTVKGSHVGAGLNHNEGESRRCRSQPQLRGAQTPRPRVGEAQTSTTVKGSTLAWGQAGWMSVETVAKGKVSYAASEPCCALP